MNYYGYECIRETDISHHGILGMKWGIRRYQNKDGTLTAAGKARERREDKQAKELSEKVKTGGPDAWKSIHDKIYSASKTSKELNSIMTEAMKLDVELDNASSEFAANKDLVRKTARAYVKDRHKEKYADYYINQEGIDAAANVWSYYVEKTPALLAKQNRINDLRASYEDASEKYFRGLLGQYANTKTSSLGRADVSRILAITSREDFNDILFRRAYEENERENFK